MCIYIYIYAILLTTNSRITLGRIDPGSPTMHERFDHRARRISRNLSARDSCALYLSLSLSLFVRVYQPRFYLGRSISLFFLFFLLPIFYISLPPSPLCFAFPPSLPPFPRSSLPRLLFILPTSSALLSRSRTAKEGGWRLVGGNWEGRSRKTWMDEKRRGEGRW